MKNFGGSRYDKEVQFLKLAVVKTDNMDEGGRTNGFSSSKKTRSCV